jgi:hypothetical protein
MAFKMKGNPFPKKNGGLSPKKQLDVELQNIIDNLDEEKQKEFQTEYKKQFDPRFDIMHKEQMDPVIDSLDLAGTDLFSKYQEGKKIWDADGDITSTDYKALIDAYNKHMEDYGGTARKRSSQIDDIVNKKLNEILNKELNESEFGQNLKKKYDDLAQEKQDSIINVAKQYVKEFDEGKMTKAKLKEILGESFFNQLDL